MSRSALRLAALASSAVPGLDPAAVEGVPVGLGDLYELAFVTDAQDRRWVVRGARTAAAGALAEDVGALMTMLARRLEVAVPVVRGVAGAAEGRAVVCARLPGQPLDFSELPAGAPLTADVGRTLAHVHNLELALFEEAGRPGYDAETHRKRMLSELDRASASGHVPAGLLSRWEQQLEDVSLWRFAPTPVHGAYTGSHVLAVFDEEDDAGTGRVRSVIGWEQARVGDPADDLAELVARAHPATLDTVLEAYVQTRIERPDRNLLERARLAAEMTPLHRLLHALSAGEAGLVAHLSARLRELDEQIRDAEERAEARRLRAEREARREREQVQAAAAAATTAGGAAADEAAAGGTDVGETIQPLAPPNAAFEGEHSGVPTSSTTNTAFEEPPGEATQPMAPPPGEATQPMAPPNAAFEGEHSGAPTSSTPNTAFEEPRSEDEDAVSDQHEGASDFVPVEARQQPRHPSEQRPLDG